MHLCVIIQEVVEGGGSWRVPGVSAAAALVILVQVLVHAQSAPTLMLLCLQVSCVAVWHGSLTLMQVMASTALPGLGIPVLLCLLLLGFESNPQQSCFP